jgi:hypothetical protein
MSELKARSRNDFKNLERNSVLGIFFIGHLLDERFGVFFPR